MAHFTQADLDKMGLKLNKDGVLQKPSNPQPRVLKREIEYKDAAGKTIGKVDEFTTIEFTSGKAKVKPSLVHFNGMDIQDVFAECEKNNTIFIPGNTPSLKNSKQIFRNSKTGKSFITSSALCKKYVESTDIHWRVFKPRFLEMIKGKEKPYKIQFFFIRDKHKAFDYINISQICLDLMQEHNWLENDDNRNVIPNFDCGFGYDPKLAGVIIKVL